MRKVLSFFILTFICGILIFAAGCNFDDLFLPYCDDEKLQMVYSIDKQFILLSGCFDSFAYDNNFAYLKIGNTYYVVDIANEVKNEYSDDEFSEMYPDYENVNWYDA